MRKTLVVAAREYLAAVRTKTFLIGLLIMPIMMGGSIVVQHLLKDVVDTTERHYALIDRTPGGEFQAVILAAVKEQHKSTVDARGVQVRPKFAVNVVTPRGVIGPDGQPDDEVQRQRAELSERVRRGELRGFAEILGGGPFQPPASAKEGAKPADKGKPKRYVTVRYQSDRVTDTAFGRLTEAAVEKDVRKRLSAKTGLKDWQEELLVHPVQREDKGLTEWDAQANKAREESEQSRIASVAAPMGLMLLMFMVVLMGATPLMQGVVEEKMQRIAEVLLGSVPPFELMMGKLVGMAGVSLTISAVYMSGALWAAHRFGFGGALGPELLAWFLVYQVLSALMFGSLFIAVGAACTDMKETQNLLWPVMLLACLPLFVLGNVIVEPNSPVAVGLSFFPFATPMMMVARMGVPPGIPWWQPALGVVVVLATTVLCVYAAGRIFRVGILMQGKGARLGEMVKWVFRG
jgi:ABC-2 type transport system permease protein